VTPPQAADHTTSPETTQAAILAERQRWMSVLAKAPPLALETLWGSIETKPDWTYLRQPETGMVMLRGRAGGTGQRFNLGEMTMTRCAVRLPDGRVGHGYVGGRDREHATRAALVDALMQDAAQRDALDAAIIAPLEQAAREARETASRKAAATKVDFFTMVRGE
jgi:alpha-D-ribose 1-methylphosphonate 5-triphosphate synthase subunit PhnG